MSDRQQQQGTWNFEEVWNHLGAQGSEAQLDSGAPTYEPVAEVRTYRQSMSVVENEEPQETTITGIHISTWPFASNVHNVCLEATQEYIRDFRRNIELRRTSTQLEDDPSMRLDMGFGTSEASQALLASPCETIYRESQPTDSLKNNIGMVCTIFWAQGRALQMLCPTSEAAAAYDMRCLIDASDRVVEGLEQMEDGTGTKAKEILEAGMKLCHCLGKLEKQDVVRRLGNLYIGNI